MFGTIVNNKFLIVVVEPMETTTTAMIGKFD
jgi:hypothetical protein